jgi:diketogulonate reductase-like aldo/keto reductase
MINIPKLQLRNGNYIPRLGLGTWLVGGAMKRNPENDDTGQIKAIKYAIEAGFSWIRTAQNYAEGHCEELVGRAISGFDREQLFISEAINQNFALSKEMLIEEAKKSLARMRTDYFDLFMIGAINPDIPIKEIADGMMQLLDTGLARNIGVSNYRLEELKFIDSYTDGKIVYDEMHYNLIIREPEITGELKYCRENNIVLSAYRPLQLGQLSRPGIEILDQMAAKYGKSQSQIALKWLIQKDGVAAIVKTFDDKEQHTEEDLAIFDWALEARDVVELDKNFPLQIRVSDCSWPRKPKFH